MKASGRGKKFGPHLRAEADPGLVCGDEVVTIVSRLVDILFIEADGGEVVDV